jgi:hypothetical protein
MWVKKSENQIYSELMATRELDKKNRLRKSFKTSIWVFIIAFFGTMFLSVTIGLGVGGDDPTPPLLLKLKEIPEYLDLFLFIALGLAILAFPYRFFRYSMFGNSSTSSSTLICNKCFKVKNYDNLNTCDCGGNFLPIDNFEWQEDPQDNVKL